MKKTTKKVTKTVTTEKTTARKEAVMIFKTMLLSKLKFNPLNPVIRTDDTHAGFKTLVSNIRNNGLLTPIIVANDGTVIDGNRRLTALTILGLYLIVFSILMLAGLQLK